MNYIVSQQQGQGAEPTSDAVVAITMLTAAIVQLLWVGRERRIAAMKETAAQKIDLFNATGKAKLGSRVTRAAAAGADKAAVLPPASPWPSSCGQHGRPPLSPGVRRRERRSRPR